MNTVKGGVTAAKGFKAAAAACGIKYTDRLDMALVYSECPAVCAGYIYKKCSKGAPVKWDKKINIRKGNDTCGCTLTAELPTHVQEKKE